MEHDSSIICVLSCYSRWVLWQIHIVTSKYKSVIWYCCCCWGGGGLCMWFWIIYYFCDNHSAWTNNCYLRFKSKFVQSGEIFQNHLKLIINCYPYVVKISFQAKLLLRNYGHLGKNRQNRVCPRESLQYS